MDEQSEPSLSPPNDQAKGRPQEPNVRFFMIVGVLLLIIIALLAGLWLRERVRATAAERDLRRLRARNEYLEAMIKQLVLDQTLPLRIDRAGLDAEEVRVNSREVTALRLPAAVAEAIGFRPGDVILVEQSAEAATKPATTRAR